MPLLLTMIAACVTSATTDGEHAALRVRVCPDGRADHHHSPSDTHLTHTVSTVNSGADIVKAARAGGHAGDITIELCEGPHRHLSPLVIGPEHTSVGLSHLKDGVIFMTYFIALICHSNLNRGFFSKPAPNYKIGRRIGHDPIDVRCSLSSYRITTSPLFIRIVPFLLLCMHTIQHTLPMKLLNSSPFTSDHRIQGPPPA